MPSHGRILPCMDLAQTASLSLSWTSVFLSRRFSREHHLHQSREPKVPTFLGFPACFRASLFPFCPLCRPPLFLPFSRHIFTLFSPSKSALFCRTKGTAQSLERAVLGWTSLKSSGKEIPSRNLRKKRSVSPLSIKNLSLQNVNWHPPKCKSVPSKKGLVTSNLQLCIELHRNHPSPIYILGCVNLHFGG